MPLASGANFTVTVHEAFGARVALHVVVARLNKAAFAPVTDIAPRVSATIPVLETVNDPVLLLPAVVLGIPTEIGDREIIGADPVPVKATD